VARVVKELLGAKLVTPHPSTEDIPSPPVVEGEVMEGCPVLIGFPSPLAASAKPAALGVAPPPPLSTGSSNREGSQRVLPP
jgi:hypothetical protein